MKQYKKWYSGVLISIMVTLILMSVIVYILDPYEQYRKSSMHVIPRVRFSSAGKLKNSEYNIAFIGSSMFTKLEMDQYKISDAVDPLKVSVGGLTAEESVLLYNLTKDKEIDKYFLSLDLYQFADGYNDPDNIDKLPNYLYNNNYLDDYKYLWGYEVWMRFLPVQVIINSIWKDSKDMPLQIQELVGNVRKENNEKDFSEILVKEKYISKTIKLSEIKSTDIYENFILNFERYITELRLDQVSSEVVFVFPPYSALFWVDLINTSKYDIFIEAKKYMIERLLEYDNVRIYDFHDFEGIGDLNHYKDTTHFDSTYGNMIIDSLLKENYIINTNNYEERIENMNVLIKDFINLNSDWIKCDTDVLK